MDDKDFCCAASKTHYEMHKGGKNLPCDWCKQHTKDAHFWGVFSKKH